MHAIMVLNDGETWTDLRGCSVMVLNCDAYDRLLDGEESVIATEATEIGAYTTTLRCGVKHDDEN